MSGYGENDIRSREATPTSSSSSQPVSMDQGAGSSASIASASSPTHSSSQGIEDPDRFKKRMELEQTMQRLQQRLKLASVKAEKGWTEMTINEIETRLPPTPKRERTPISPADQPLATTSAIPYEPPSPSRPWQLIDVLWQPLPPPRNSTVPLSPASPRKRSRDDADRFLQPQNYPSMNGYHAGPSSHNRRASGSNFHPHSPVGSVRWERRSQSTSRANRNSMPPTTQDVDAAKALTAMFESGSPQSAARTPKPPNSITAEKQRSHRDGLLPPITTSALEDPGFPSPLKETTKSRSAASSPVSTPNRRRGSKRKTSADTNESNATSDADQDAAELMMFLAHSPSPARTIRQSPSRTLASPARVLFAESDSKVERHSNLALAPPITAETGISG